ncbi:MAG: hypothetical protein FJ211_02040 [Ignavibacteria bacterium]|nr:hypothetical protein [Ignavibacteria bacterium]
MQPNVVAPNYFDAIVHPEVIMPLVLSHLLSDSLWERRDAVVERLDGLEPADPSIPVELFAIKRFIDKNFEHVHPNFIGQINGMLNVHEESRRLEEQHVQRAMQGLDYYTKYCEMRGAHDSSWMQQSIASGVFPNYTYTTYDVIRAHRTFSQHRKGSSFGIVSCLDEMSLFCAAALTLPKDYVSKVIILTGPTHYTVMLWDAHRRGYWFPAKRYLFSSRSWADHVDTKYNGDVELAYNDILCQTNRIISTHGSFDIENGTSSIPLDFLRETIHDIRELLGYLPESLQSALGRSIEQRPSSPYADVFASIAGVSSIEAVRLDIHAAAASGQEWAEEVLLAYRSADMMHHPRFVAAAMQSPLARKVARGMQSPEEAAAFVDSIPGYESIFGDDHRIALPDETLRMQTGTERDRSILLDVLTKHLGGMLTNSNIL